MARADQQSIGNGTAVAPPRRRARATVILVFVLAILWVLFSGKLDVIHLSYGALSIILVAVLTRGLVGSRSDPRQDEALASIRWGKALLYPFWLVGQIVLANLGVAKLVVAPSMPIDPILIHFKTGMQGPICRVTLGNSITLTPGTFTIRIDDDEFLVHAIHEDLAGGLLDGSMQRKVAEVYGETLRDDLQIRVIRDVASFLAEEQRG